MNIQNRVAKLEDAAGIIKGCAGCLLIKQGRQECLPPTDTIPGHCPICGRAYDIDVSGASKQRRDVIEIFFSIPFIKMPRNKKECAATCWLARHAADQEPGEAFISHSRKVMERASDESRKLFSEVHAMTDAELERIIWPDESIAA